MWNHKGQKDPEGGRFFTQKNGFVTLVFLWFDPARYRAVVENSQHHQ